MDRSSIAEAARRLRVAAATGKQCAPVRHLLGSDTDIEAAYAVQQANVALAVAGGRRASGHKIGLTSPAVQEQLGFGQPVSGVLFADTCVPDGLDIPAGRLVQPRAEGEIAVVLEGDLDKGTHTVVDIIGAVAYVLPALEIVDSRSAHWDITIVDMVADNACSGLYVLGSRPVPLSALDLRDVDMRITLNGTTASIGRGSACLGNPLNALVWLADALCERGTPLGAGDCIMTGSLGSMVPLSPGDEIRAVLNPIGTVSTRLGAAGG
ncbi:MAG: fumarylacetoacetate hydrolase family protein [bacterium]|nr:fumarylacetoacetate hydrolase family protein [bacterium]